MMLIFLIATPFLAAILSVFSYGRRAVAETVSVLASVVEAGLGIYIALQVASTGSVSFSGYLQIDSLGAVFLLSIIGARVFSTLYSVGYIRTEMDKHIIGFGRMREYYVLLNLFIMALFIAIAANNPILMWIALEATTLITVFLVSIYNNPIATEAAWKYLVLNLLGLLLAFFGIFIFLDVTTSGVSFVSWADMQRAAQDADPMALKIAFAFIFIGYGTKAGLFPMHTWLPDAHSRAPTPISSLLSGVLVNVAFLAILRFKIVTDIALGAEFTQQLFLVFGTASIVFSAFVLLALKSYKRLLAYSTIEHVGIMIAGFGLGGFAVYASLLHMMYHTFIKSFLFLAAGNIFVKYGSSQIANVRGLRSVLPATSVFFVGGLLAISGFPLFGIFMSEFYVLAYGMTVHPYISVTIGISFLLAFIAFFRHLSCMLFGTAPSDIQPGESNRWMIVPLAAYALLIVLASLYLPEQLQALLVNAYTSFNL